MSDGMKLVAFEKYCRRCKNRKLDETKNPCNECLSEGGMLYSHKPLHFEKGGRENGRRNKGTSGTAQKPSRE